MEDKHKYCDDCQRIVDWDESNCPQCGSWLIDLDEIIVTPQPDPQPERCAECNFLIENCVCDNNNVNECPNCGLPHCSGECMNIGGDGTVSGGTEVPNNPTYYLISASVNPVNAGNIYGTGIYKAGSDVTLTVTGNQNYIFAYWKGDLSGSNHSSTFKASKDIDATAVFFHKDSACGKLLRNYNQNILLKESVEQINNIVTDTTKNKIEYGYYPFNNTLEYVIGTSSGVKIPNNKGVLDFFTHNHPSNILIPSIEDIIGLYRCYKNSRFSNNSKLILATISGTLAIEIFDIHLLESFLADWALLSTSEEELSTYCKAYHQMFNDEVLGNPTASQKQELSCTEMAIDYYMQYGLKFLHRFSSEPSNEWFYASWDEGGKIRFENCLNN